MTSKSNERKTSNEVKQQQLKSQKPPGGSPKQELSQGVLLSLHKSPKNIKGKLHNGKNK